MSFTPQTSSSSEETQFLSLPNGCLCCSIKEPGIAAIENMLLEQTGIDRVVVELTGVADPGKMIWDLTRY
jgi:G3E family GTPase